MADYFVLLYCLHFYFMFYNIVVNQYYCINLHCIALMKCNIHINIHKTINSLFDFGKK